MHHIVIEMVAVLASTDPLVPPPSKSAGPNTMFCAGCVGCILIAQLPNNPDVNGTFATARYILIK